MLTVFVLDDDTSVLEAVSMVLVRKNISVISLNNASQLSILLEQHHPDLLLMDIMLGTHDGRDLCRDIKRSGARMPVVLMSGHNATDESIRECAADAMIRKPFLLSELFTVIEQLPQVPLLHTRPGRGDYNSSTLPL